MWIVISKTEMSIPKDGLSKPFFSVNMVCHVFYLDLDLDGLSIKSNTHNNEQELLSFACMVNLRVPKHFYLYVMYLHIFLTVVAVLFI